MATNLLDTSPCPGLPRHVPGRAPSRLAPASSWLAHLSGMDPRRPAVRHRRGTSHGWWTRPQAAIGTYDVIEVCKPLPTGPSWMARGVRVDRDPGPPLVFGGPELRIRCRDTP